MDRKVWMDALEQLGIVTVLGAAELTGEDERTIRNAIEAKSLPAVRLGKQKWLMHRADVENYQANKIDNRTRAVRQQNGRSAIK